MTFKPLILAAAFSVLAGSAFAADVAVTLTGVEPQGGTMLVSLQTRDQFMKPAGAAGAMGAAEAGTMKLTIENVEPGEYAVMVMHDADSNWTMAMKDGKPAEGFGHSGSGGQNFDAVKIVVPAGGAAVTVPMIYPK
jgi:uncharacterized protein (DUF2141 family)